MSLEALKGAARLIDFADPPCATCLAPRTDLDAKLPLSSSVHFFAMVPQAEGVLRYLYPRSALSDARVAPEWHIEARWRRALRGSRRIARQPGEGLCEGEHSRRAASLR
jgi:hypothetical protein